jgi:hypothetical protein
MAAVTCGCSTSASDGAASRPTAPSTVVVQNLQAAPQTVSAAVSKSCYDVRMVRVQRTFATEQDGFAFAAAHLFPVWRDGAEPFLSIGDRKGLRFFMRSMSRADVIAFTVVAGRWSILGTGHC